MILNIYDWDGSLKENLNGRLLTSTWIVEVSDLFSIAVLKACDSNHS